MFKLRMPYMHEHAVNKQYQFYPPQETTKTKKKEALEQHPHNGSSDTSGESRMVVIRSLVGRKKNKGLYTCLKNERKKKRLVLSKEKKANLYFGCRRAVAIQIVNTINTGE